MTKLRLFCISLLAFALLLGADEVVRYLARREPSRLKIARIELVPRETGCISIGNSLMDAGFDTDAFDASVSNGYCRSLNAALGATQPAEHDVLLNAALTRIARPRIIYYGWFDRQLTISSRVAINDLIGNRNVGLLLDPDREIALSDMVWPVWLSYKLLDHFALFVERGSVWGKIEILRRRLHAIGLPASEGLAPDPFRALEASSGPAFEALLEEDLQRQVPLSRPVADVLELTRKRGARPIVVLMPMPKEHRDRFFSPQVWHRYLDYVGNLIARDGGELCDASDWITDPALFADVLHLNRAGAAEFSRRLARATLGDDAAACSPH
jgi:hypothetical protein